MLPPHTSCRRPPLSTSGLPVLWDGDASVQAAKVDLLAQWLIGIAFEEPTEPIMTLRLCGWSTTSGEIGSVSVSFTTTTDSLFLEPVTLPWTAPGGCTQPQLMYSYPYPGYIYTGPGPEEPLTPLITSIQIIASSGVSLTEVELCPVPGRELPA